MEAIYSLKMISMVLKSLFFF